MTISQVQNLLLISNFYERLLTANTNRCRT